MTTPTKLPPQPLDATDLMKELYLKIERLEFDIDSRVATIARQDNLLLIQTEAIADSQWRLVLSQSFSKLMVKAYTALQSHRVDYRKLPSYKNFDGINWFEGSDTLRYREAMTRWITEINHDIDAAIRRKSIKEVPLK